MSHSPESIDSIATRLVVESAPNPELEKLIDTFVGHAQERLLAEDEIARLEAQIKKLQSTKSYHTTQEVLSRSMVLTAMQQSNLREYFSRSHVHVEVQQPQWLRRLYAHETLVVVNSDAVFGEKA